MARDDKSLDELDEEMKKLEAELRALEEGEDPEDLDLEDREAGPEEGEEAQPPEEADDEAPEDEGSRGLLGKLPFGSSDEEPGDDEEPDETEGPPHPEDHEGPTDAEKTEPPEEALEAGEDDEEDQEGALGGLVSRFKRDKDEDAEEAAPPEAAYQEEPAEAEEAEPPEDDEKSRIKGLIGRFKREKDAEDEEDAEADETPDGPADTPTEAEETEPPEEEPAEEAPPEDLAAEAPAPEPPAEDEIDPAEIQRRRESDLWERTPEGRWRRKHPDEIQAEEAEPAEEEEDQSRARALLSRFGASSSRDEPPVETSDETALVPVEDEGDDGRAIPVWVLWILLGVVIVGLIAGAAVLLGGDDGGAGGAAGPTAAATVADGSPAPGGGFVGLVGEEVTFDASGTTGTVDSYEWDFGDGQTATTDTATTTHAYASRGSFNVTLTAVGEGSEDTASIQLLVVQAPQASPSVLVGGEPAAGPGESGNHAVVGESVTLDASGSSADPESSLAAFAWDLDGDGTAEANGETAQASFDAVGAWNVSLTVTDDLGNTNTSVVPVGVGRVDVFSDTVGQAIGEASANEHPLPVDAGRQGGQPFELTASLNYTPPQAGINENLDLILVPPEGDPFQAEDDGGSGQETISLSGADLSALGQWTVRVEHRSPSTNSVDYEVTVELVY